MVLRCLTLQTWCSARLSPGVYAWTLHRDVDLSTLLALDTSFPYSCNVDVKILCTFEDRDIVIVRAKEEVFQLDITTMAWKS